MLRITLLQNLPLEAGRAPRVVAVMFSSYQPPVRSLFVLVLFRHHVLKWSNLGCKLLTLSVMTALLYLRGPKQHFKDSQPALQMASLAKSTWHKLGNAQMVCNFHLHLSHTGLGAGGVIGESNTMKLEVLGWRGLAKPANIPLAQFRALPVISRQVLSWENTFRQQGLTRHFTYFTAFIITL